MNIISIGDEVLTRRFGSARVELIEYEGQFLERVDVRDCNNERFTFTLDNGRWVYGSQIVSMPKPTEIIYER